MLARLICRSLLQRIPVRRKLRSLAYFTENIAARMRAATWQLERHQGTGTVLEIGCGRDLHTSLCAAVRFGKRVIAHDVERIAHIELINFTLQHLGSVLRIAHTDDLRKIGVEYVVADSINTIAQFDGVVSTASFEHIPARALEDIFAVMRERMPSGGICTANVDYTDHWSYIEDVREDNFYYVGEGLWRILNTGSMHQNRLRHPDVLAMAARHGFRAQDVELAHFARAIDAAKLKPRFSRYGVEDLSICSAMIAWRRD
jgi:cyclopropane fatty-acyl-phospholipid synthase-like methyltransferase